MAGSSSASSTMRHQQGKIPPSTTPPKPSGQGRDDLVPNQARFLADKIVLRSGSSSNAWPGVTTVPELDGNESWEFQAVLLRQSTEAKLGIVYHTFADENHEARHVREIKPEGVCAAYNSHISHYPISSSSFLRQIVPGDLIISVNGKSNAVALKEELLSSLTVHIHMKRPPGSTDAAF
jgi:hypothetical protein